MQGLERAKYYKDQFKHFRGVFNMKPYIQTLPFDEKYLAKPVEKSVKKMPDISPSAPLPEDYVKHEKDAKPNSADYEKYTMENV